MIRNAVASDVDELLVIYESARAYMRACGNPTQWPEGYIGRDLLEEDIGDGKLYAVVRNGQTRGVFYFAVEEDPTYAVIENGSWLDASPYGVIHRIASDGKDRGILDEAVTFALGKINHIRIDTHADNRVMQSLLRKNGFSPRGIIYVHGHSPRIAYELVK